MIYRLRCKLNGFLLGIAIRNTEFATRFIGWAALRPLVASDPEPSGLPVLYRDFTKPVDYPEEIHLTVPEELFALVGITGGEVGDEVGR